MKSVSSLKTITVIKKNSAFKTQSFINVKIKLWKICSQFYCSAKNKNQKILSIIFHSYKTSLKTK